MKKHEAYICRAPSILIIWPSEVVEKIPFQKWIEEGARILSRCGNKNPVDFSALFDCFGRLFFPLFPNYLHHRNLSEKRACPGVLWCMQRTGFLHQHWAGKIPRWKIKYRVWNQKNTKGSGLLLCLGKFIYNQTVSDTPPQLIESRHLPNRKVLGPKKVWKKWADTSRSQWIRQLGFNQQACSPT